MTANRYVFFRNDFLKENFDFDPSDPACLDRVGFAYFGRVLNLLEPMIRDQGLVFYVTAWTVHELPSYGPNVVACILQDEWSREPPYRHKVGAVFKTCGLNPFTSAAYGYGGFADTISNILGQLRAAAKGTFGHVTSLKSSITGGGLAPVYNMPLGYYAHEDIQFIPMEERQYDLFFAGSVKHRSDAPLGIKGPKEHARERMARALSSLKGQYPNIIYENKVTGSFNDSIQTDNSAYLKNMMNTRICLVPRGANLETYRFYEGLRYGCIPVGEAFPDEEFYKDAPIIRLDDWSDLGEVVSGLLQDQRRMEELHQRSLVWWRDVCSEMALAEDIASSLSVLKK